MNPSSIPRFSSVRQSRAVARPTVSVVIPAHARIAKLQRCLEALANQTLPRDEFEVIVCDDGSPEPIAPALGRFADVLTLTVVRKARGGPAAARNEGARHASGALLAFTDDDCVPEEDWLEHLVANIGRNPGHLLGGSIVNLLPDDPYATATQLITSCVYDYYARHPESRRLYCTANLALPTSRFWLLNGFSEQYQRAAGEDYDFCARWTEAGFPNHYAPEATVGHAHGHTLTSFWKQHFGYGRALLRVRLGMARRRGRGVIALEAPSFYSDILAYPILHTAGSRVSRGKATMLVLLSQMATALGALREWIAPDEGWRGRARHGRRGRSKAPSAVS
ncbi:MAG TPA: glycosyltransferase [Gemmatimonadaceae bacterium]